MTLSNLLFNKFSKYYLTIFITHEIIYKKKIIMITWLFDLFNITISLIILFILYCTCYLIKHIRELNAIPGTWQLAFSPLKLPLISPYLYLGSYKEIFDLANRIGDPITKLLRISMVTNNTLFISDPHHLKEIVMKQGHLLGKPNIIYEMLNIFGWNILTLSDREEWKKHHHIVSPGFSEENMKYLCDVTVDSTDILMKKKWLNFQTENNSATFGQPTNTKNNFFIDLNPDRDLTDLTLDILGKAGFGYNFGIFNEEESTFQPSNTTSKASAQQEQKEQYIYHHSFREAVSLTLRRTTLIKRFLSREPFYSLALKLFNCYHATNDVSHYIDELIEKRKLEKIKDKTDILSLMVYSNELVEDKLTNEEIKSDALIFILAGHETTTTTLQWLMFELCRHPEIQEKMREEINKVLPNKEKPKIEHFSQLHYVNQVIKETLRLHPPVGGVGKIAKTNLKLGNITIPKGTHIFVNIYGLHHDKNYWTNPQEFNPDRFDESNKEGISPIIIKPLTFIPFSLGMRKCIGSQFSLYETCMIITRCLQFMSFKFSPEMKVEPHEVKGKQIITIKPTDDFIIRIEPLEQQVREEQLVNLQEKNITEKSNVVTISSLP